MCEEEHINETITNKSLNFFAVLKTLMKWSCEVIKRDNDEYWNMKMKWYILPD